MALYDEKFKEWIATHINDDPTRLRLGKRPDAPWVDDAINHIENKRKSRSKFALAGYEQFIPQILPIPLSVEQASSARIALLHRQLSGLDKSTGHNTVLDMTCGLGLDASFMASDSNTSLIAIEKDPHIFQVAQYNFADRANIDVIEGDSVQYLESTDKHFDLIFIDPARRSVSGGRVYNLRDCIPDVTSILPLMKSKGDRIMIKMSPMLDVTQTIRDLEPLNELYVVGERGECRELLAIIDSKNTQPETLITVWSDATTFSFTQSQEIKAIADIAFPKPGQYLLEPSAALMKAGPFKLLCSRYNAAMIHANTHLYITNEVPQNFPGKVYRITDILPYSSSNIKRIAKQRLAADVAVRNFPITADALRLRLGIKKSGVTRIVGITACDSNQYLLFLD